MWTVDDVPEKDPLEGPREIITASELVKSCKQPSWSFPETLLKVHSVHGVRHIKQN